MQYWTIDEEHQLIDLLDAGTPLEEVAERFHRSVDAIVVKAKRLGVAIPDACRVKKRTSKVTTSGTTTTTRTDALPPITPAQDLISLAEMMKTLLGALDQLQNPGLSSLELKRFRSLVAGARTYMAMLEKYEHWTRIEQRLVDMEARTLESLRTTVQRTTDPAEKARIEQHIRQLEETLKDEKFYTPFHKKPSLLTPVS